MLIYLQLIEAEEDKKSFEKQYQDNYLKMYHVAFKMLCNQMDAENAVHDAFLSIAERYEKYSELSCSEFTGLCVTIVKNKAIDIIRKKNKLSAEKVEELVLYNENADFEPEKMVDRKEQNTQIHKLISQLPDTYKVILDLKFYYNYSNREIAKILDISTKNVEMRLYRAKQRMKELIENEYE